MPPPARKSLGQHFLSDPGILNRIAEALEPRPGETVLEIGPGRGGLTAALLRHAPRLVAIERDRALIPELRRQFPTVEIVEGDALELDWHALVGPGPFVLAGNIPYNITSPLLERALRPPRPRCIVFLVQLEVARRLGAAPGRPEYGALTIGVRVVADVELLFRVPAGAFRPRPLVDSAVVRLTPRGAPELADTEVPAFRRLVVGLFGFRRKQLIRGLREFTGLPATDLLPLLEGDGVLPERRPETVPPEGFVQLYRRLNQAGALPSD